MEPQVRISARALIGDGARLVMCWNKEEQFYFLPGGGLELMEDLKTGLARELKEELSFEAPIGSFVGCIENHWQYRGQVYQEFCFVFRMSAPTTWLDRPIVSNEPHISFEVLPLKQICSLNNVLPVRLPSFLTQYYDQQSAYIWSSELSADTSSKQE